MSRSQGPLGPLVFIVLVSGCSPSLPASTAPPMADGQRLLVVSDSPGPLAAEQPIAVLSAPQVFPVWVPSHVDRDRDLLVGEHWVFFKLTESEWFTDRQLAASDPLAKGDASPADLAPLRALSGFDRAVVPYRESK